jgi:hypothetical protein
LVSKNYIEGKRARYSNPFRFYLTASVLFFLIIGAYKTKQKYLELNKIATEEKINLHDKRNTSRDSLPQNKKDSIKFILERQLNEFPIAIPEKTKKKILKDAEENLKKDEKNKLESLGNGNINFSIEKDSKFEKFINFGKKNPKISVDNALDSLNYPKNFTNRFLYTKAKNIHEVFENENLRSQYFNQLLSYGSIGLFVFLPLFTLCLKLFYIRRKFNYVDHLIFVFHTQTVFFLLFSLYFLLSIFGTEVQWIFIALFLLYLFMAMRKFYNQSFFKTLIKYFLVNMSFLILGSMASVAILLISFALY